MLMTTCMHVSMIFSAPLVVLGKEGRAKVDLEQTPSAFPYPAPVRPSVYPGGLSDTAQPDGATFGGNAVKSSADANHMFTIRGLKKHRVHTISK